MLLCLCSPASGGFSHGEHYGLRQLYAAIRSLESLNGDLVRVYEFGRSVEGRPLLAVRVALPDGEERGEALVTAGIHAHEWTSSRVALAMAERLIRGHGQDKWTDGLLEKTDFYFLPLLNPDGYYRADRHLKLGYTWARDNADHVDLNRNWPFPEGVKVRDFRAGSNFMWSPHYWGPEPFSEPETRAVEMFVREHRFYTSINLHTTGGHFTFPWSYKEENTPHHDIFLAMGAALNEHQELYKYKVHPSYDWYQTIGALNDWLYGRHGVLSVTVEVAKIEVEDVHPLRAMNPFWWYNPEDVGKWIDNDCDAVLHAIETACSETGCRPVRPRQMNWVMGALSGDSCYEK
jgi:predicted deacylase